MTMETCDRDSRDVHPASPAKSTSPARENGRSPGAGGSPSFKAKVLCKKESVRDIKKEKKDKKESSGGHNKDKKEKRDSQVDLQSTGSASSGADREGREAKETKEVKFREPDGAERTGDDSSLEFAGTPGSPKVPHKFISNWKHACDKTRDRTRDLLKRWRTAPEGGEGHSGPPTSSTSEEAKEPGHGWSVHVWATWVKRLPSEEEGFPNNLSENSASILTPVQRDKLSQFFAHLVDIDRDDVVSKQDFEHFSERMRHFADWSNNSSEYHILREVEQGFVNTFVDQPTDDDAVPGLEVAGEKLCTLDQWLSRWGTILNDSTTFQDLPVWLQYFPKVMFQVINKSGSGTITRDELSSFYSSVLGLGPQRVGEILDTAYKAMTANGDYPLCFRAYRWCFANFVLGRHRNGPGQFLFGPGEASDVRECPFPVDYSALNTAPEELEQYSPDRKSNRRSVVV